MTNLVFKMWVPSLSSDSSRPVDPEILSVVEELSTARPRGLDVPVSALVTGLLDVREQLPGLLDTPLYDRLGGPRFQCVFDHGLGLPEVVARRPLDRQFAGRDEVVVEVPEALVSHGRSPTR